MIVDLLAAAGLGGASGIRPVLPALVCGALATTDTIVDYDGTALAFMESPVVLVVLVLLATVLIALEQRGGLTDQISTALVGLGAVLGALTGAAVLDDQHDLWWPGLLAGGAAAVLIGFALRPILSGARSRLGEGEQGFLLIYTAAACLGLIGLSLVFGPLSLLAFAGAIWLLIGSRRRAGEKYAGLRILGK